MRQHKTKPSFGVREVIKHPPHSLLGRSILLARLSGLVELCRKIVTTVPRDLPFRFELDTPYIVCFTNRRDAREVGPRAGVCSMRFVQRAPASLQGQIY